MFKSKSLKIKKEEARRESQKKKVTSTNKNLFIQFPFP